MNEYWPRKCRERQKAQKNSKFDTEEYRKADHKSLKTDSGKNKTTNYTPCQPVKKEQRIQNFNFDEEKAEK